MTPSVQPIPAAHVDQASGTVRVVAHQDGLPAVDLTVTDPHRQRRPTADQQVGQHRQDGALLVVPVLRALHDLRVGTEGGVVHKGAVLNQTEVDAYLDTF